MVTIIEAKSDDEKNQRCEHFGKADTELQHLCSEWRYFRDKPGGKLKFTCSVACRNKSRAYQEFEMGSSKDD